MKEVMTTPGFLLQEVAVVLGQSFRTFPVAVQAVRPACCTVGIPFLPPTT